mgnify:CR=1 FL=1
MAVSLSTLKNAEPGRNLQDESFLTACRSTVVTLFFSICIVISVIIGRLNLVALSSSSWCAGHPKGRRQTGKITFKNK